MSNLREEIIKLTIKELETRVSNIMLEINILLSKPENIQDLVKKVADLITTLSITENSLNQAKSFHAQILAERMALIKDLVGPNKDETK